MVEVSIVVEAGLPFGSSEVMILVWLSEAEDKLSEESKGLLLVSATAEDADEPKDIFWEAMKPFEV